MNVTQPNSITKPVCKTPCNRDTCIAVAIGDIKAPKKNVAAAGQGGNGNIKSESCITNFFPNSNGNAIKHT